MGAGTGAVEYSTVVIVEYSQQDQGDLIPLGADGGVRVHVTASQPRTVGHRVLRPLRAGRAGPHHRPVRPELPPGGLVIPHLHIL